MRGVRTTGRCRRHIYVRPNQCDVVVLHQQATAAAATRSLLQLLQPRTMSTPPAPGIFRQLAPTTTRSRRPSRLQIRQVLVAPAINFGVVAEEMAWGQFLSLPNFGMSENCRKIFILSKKFFFQKYQIWGWKTPILEKFKDKIKISSNHNLFCLKFEAVYRSVESPKIENSCPVFFSNSRCRWRELHYFDLAWICRTCSNSETLLSNIIISDYLVFLRRFSGCGILWLFA